MAQKKLQRNEKKLYFCGVKINELNMNNRFSGISLNAIGESRRDYKKQARSKRAFLVSFRYEQSSIRHQQPIQPLPQPRR
jgi:hypothetical protein